MSIVKLLGAIGAGTVAGVGGASVVRAQTQWQLPPSPTLPPNPALGPGGGGGERPRPRPRRDEVVETQAPQPRVAQPRPAPAQPKAPPPVAVQPTAPVTTATPVRESSFDQRRRELRAEAEQLRAAIKRETDSRGGYGPNAQAAQKRLEAVQGDLAKVDADEKKSPSTLRSVAEVGIPLALALIGAKFGSMLARSMVNNARASGTATIAGVERLAAESARLVKGQPKGVLHGTVPGDRALANVQAANAALATRPGSLGAAAYAVPVLMAAEAGASVYYRTVSDDPNSKMAATSLAALGVAATVFTAKGMLGARRLSASPAAMAKLTAVTNRLVRESSGKISGVTQARAATRVAQAEGATRVARAKATGAVKINEAQAAATVGVTRARGQSRVAAARLKADTAQAVDGQKAKAAIAKAQGSARRARAKAQLPAPQVSTPPPPPPPKAPAAKPRSTQRRPYVARQRAPYKDTWTDSRGRVYHRKDVGIRKH